MSGQFTTSEDSSRGGLGIVLFICWVVAFLLTIAVEAGYMRWHNTRAGKATEQVDEFNSSPIADLIQPQRQLTPAQVVEIQLASLADRDMSRGIQQCFAFASPGNRELTGPLPRFAAMVRRPPYAVLMSPQMRLVGRPISDGKVAAVVVTLVDDHDGIHAFQFLLSRQDGGDVDDCWMTDAVYRLDAVPQGPASPSATAQTPANTQMDRMSGAHAGVAGSADG